MNKVSPEMREILADVSHDIWAHWMRYMFSKCMTEFSTDCYTCKLDDGDLIIPADLVQRWKRQMDTHYSGLTYQEQESDREQADRIMKTLIVNDVSMAKISQYIVWLTENNK